MKITEIRITLSRFPQSKIRAFVSVTFDEEFAVHGFKVIEGRKGLFVAMPARKTSDGEYREVAHPIQLPFRDRLQQEILRAFEDEMAKPEHRNPAPSVPS